jgi:hypothetical protein
MGPSAKPVLPLVSKERECQSTAPPAVRAGTGSWVRLAAVAMSSALQRCWLTSIVVRTLLPVLSNDSRHCTSPTP